MSGQHAEQQAFRQGRANRPAAARCASRKPGEAGKAGIRRSRDTSPCDRIRTSQCRPAGPTSRQESGGAGSVALGVVGLQPPLRQALPPATSSARHGDRSALVPCGHALASALVGEGRLKPSGCSPPPASGAASSPDARARGQVVWRCASKSRPCPAAHLRCATKKNRPMSRNWLYCNARPAMQADQLLVEAPSPHNPWRSCPRNTATIAIARTKSLGRAQATTWGFLQGQGVRISPSRPLGAVMAIVLIIARPQPASRGLQPAPRRQRGGSLLIPRTPHPGARLCWP